MSKLRPSIPKSEAPDPTARLEDYLDHACVPLVGIVPYERRQELRQEWRAHLEALADACAELGLDPEAAVEAALRQFGEPRRMGEQWVREWNRTAKPVSVSDWPTVRTAFSCFLPATVCAWLVIWNSQVHGAGSDVQAFSVGVLIPMAAGLLSGLLTTGRRAVGVALALGVLVLSTLGLSFLFGRVLPEQASTPFLVVLLCQNALWIPLGGLAAEFSGRLSDRREAAARRWALR